MLPARSNKYLQSRQPVPADENTDCIGSIETYANVKKWNETNAKGTETASPTRSARVPGREYGDSLCGCIRLLPALSAPLERR